MFSPKQAAIFAAIFVTLLSTSPVLSNEEHPRGKVIDDTIITTKVKTQLLEDDRTQGLKVTVTTRHGVVHLVGEVNSDEALYATIERTYATAGVEGVDISHLKVVPRSKHPFDDGVTTAKIKGLYLREKIFGVQPVKFGVTVDTRNGVVYLTGTVDNKKQFNAAEEIAQSVKGVKAVKNELTIKNSD